MSDKGEGLGDLILRLQGGEVGARELLASRLRGLVVFLGRRIDKGGLYATSDLAQSIVILLLLRLEQPDFAVRTDGEIRGYVQAAVRNTADKKRARGRALKRAGNAVALGEDPPSDEPSPAEVAEHRERLQALRIALRYLSPQERAVLDRVVDGEPLRRIAEALGQSESNVRKIRDRAHKKLRERLGREPAAGSRPTPPDPSTPQDESP